MKKRKILLVIWIVYIIALAYILFIRRLGVTHGVTYREWLSQFYNLIPGRVIYDYLTAPYQAPVVLRRMIFNYAGNLLLFVPWGVLFAAGKTSIKRFAILTGISIISIELLQFFTTLGSFDIEDIILNMSGAMIGFLLFRRVKN